MIFIIYHEPAWQANIRCAIRIRLQLAKPSHMVIIPIRNSFRLDDIVFLGWD